jgi:transcriptional regulator with XRE-family HTH domain
MSTDKTTAKIAENLKEIRQKRGLTQVEVADKAGLHVNSYAKIERGEAMPEVETLGKIAKALRVKSSDILPF